MNYQMKRREIPLNKAIGCNKVLCESGKVAYRSYYSATRRLKWEGRHYVDADGSAGRVYKCSICGNYHITRHDIRHKVKYNRSKMKGRNAKRVPRASDRRAKELLDEEE